MEQVPGRLRKLQIAGAPDSASRAITAAAPRVDWLRARLIGPPKPREGGLVLKHGGRRIVPSNGNGRRVAPTAGLCFAVKLAPAGVPLTGEGVAAATTSRSGEQVRLVARLPDQVCN